MIYLTFLRHSKLTRCVICGDGHNKCFVVMVTINDSELALPSCESLDAQRLVFDRKSERKVAYLLDALQILNRVGALQIFNESFCGNI